MLIVAYIIIISLVCSSYPLRKLWGISRPHGQKGYRDFARAHIAKHSLLAFTVTLEKKVACYHNDSGTIHVCAPSGQRFVHSGTCPDCGQWTRFIGHEYEWYGPDKTCLKCGRCWSDGEWMPLDFVRQSRQKSIEAAKASWKRSIAIDNNGTLNA